jgi:hypothetical protein
MHDVGALKKRHSRCTIACSQERRASARRALRYEPCAARITHRWPTARPWNRSGAHQPAVLWKSRLRGRFGTQSRDTSRATKSGGRQPAVDVVTASATAFVHGRPAGRRCAAIVVLPLQARYTNHGWLTLAAPDARRRCTEKNDIRGAQSHVPKSGGRQPAVDLVTASATAFVPGRPAGRRCAAIVVLPLQARYTNHGWLTPATPDARRRCTEKTTFAVHNRMFPRAAGVSPPWMW